MVHLGFTKSKQNKTVLFFKKYVELCHEQILGLAVMGNLKPTIGQRQLP